MRLFRFFDEIGAIRTIEERRLRVGRLHTLNDPFEFLPGVSGIVEAGADLADQQMQKLVREIGEKTGVLCFSQNATEPVLWSHYANHHRGIVLEFEVTDDQQKCVKIDYRNDRPCVDINRFYREGDDYIKPILLSLISRKSPGWSYEDERRLYEGLEDCELGGGFYFRPFPEQSLRRVILGWRCSIELSYIRRAISKAGYSGCLVTRARSTSDSYAIDFDRAELEWKQGGVKLGDDD